MEIKKGSRIAVIGAGISDIAAPKILKKNACLLCASWRGELELPSAEKKEQGIEMIRD
ncbi:MAG TPA: hypothetical protein VKE92_04870 [Anaerolineales bacterium]|nr:hypothetical protein [Anaerolineales bacterium]